MKHTALAWMLALLAHPQAPLRAQAPASPAQPPVSKGEWARLSSVAAALCSEQGTQGLYISQPALADSFASDAFFSEFVAKWRPRLSPLPAAWKEGGNIDVDVRHREDGTTTYMVTFHHEQPENAITILKTVWQDQALIKVDFMKGFSHVSFDNASKIRQQNQADDYQRQVQQYYQSRGRR